MSKFFCTATIFAVIISVIALVVMSPVRMPNSPVWWTSDGNIEAAHGCAVPLPIDSTVPFWEWSLAQVIVPLFGSIVAGGVLWTISYFICSKLRGEE